MFPEWFTQPDTIFKLVLFLISPGYVWLAKKLWKVFEEWKASDSERIARSRLVSLRKSLNNPPTLLESVAYLVCGLPLPIALATMIGTLYFAPFHPTPVYQVDFHTGESVIYMLLFVIFFLNYVLFATLTIYGITLAYRLRHGEAHYADNYKKGIQKQIDRLTKKFPILSE